MQDMKQIVSRDNKTTKQSLNLQKSMKNKIKLSSGGIKNPALSNASAAKRKWYTKNEFKIRYNQHTSNSTLKNKKTQPHL